jgi:outer membrane protein assembly factor BamB
MGHSPKKKGSPMLDPRWRRCAGALMCVTVAAGCSTGTDEAATGTSITKPVVASYDGGLYVLDGETLELEQDIPLPGFVRVNPAGDEAHVLVTTDAGFRILDAASGRLADDTFPAVEAGHVVPHGEKTVLFADGSGEITAFDPHTLAQGVPETQTFTTPHPHHGVAVILSNGTLVHSIGTSESRTGAVALRGDQEVARSQQCPGVHGETVVADENVVLGCEDGALVFDGDRFTKVSSPTPYGRVGNIKGHSESPIALGDMKVDPDAELERPEQFSLIDTTTGTLDVVTLPPSVSYSFRSLARGPEAEALILGTDGKLYAFDPGTGAQISSVDITRPWTEPDDWQDPRPTVFTREDAVYVTDPATKQIHLVDVHSGDVTASVTLEHSPNELSGPIGHSH